MRKVLDWLLVAVVALSPLPLGSARPWAWSLLAALVAVLMVLRGAVTLLQPARGPGVPAWRLLVPIALAGAFLCWTSLQMSTVLPAVWGHPMWSELADLGRSGAARVTLDVDATLVAIMRLLTYVLVFYLAYQLGLDRQRAQRALLALFAAASLYALYAVVLSATNSETILGYRKWAYVGYATGTFVNKNSFATYAGIGVVIGLSLLVEQLQKLEHSGLPGRRLLLAMLQKFGASGSVILAGTLLLFSAVLLTKSRAGFAATATGVAFVAAVAFWRSATLWGRLIPATALAAGLLWTLLTGGVTLNLVAQTDMDHEDRPYMNRVMLDAIGASPWLGYGYGSFKPAFTLNARESYPGLRSPDLRLGTLDRGHDDYLEGALGAGIPAVILLWAAIGLVFARCVAGALTRRRAMALPMAASAATIVIGVHSVADFSLQIPAVAATFALLLGLGYAQAWRS